MILVSCTAFPRQFSIITCCHDDERAALLSFKSQLNDPLNREGQNCCKEHGIRCSESLHVMAIIYQSGEPEFWWIQINLLIKFRTRSHLRLHIYSHYWYYLFISIFPWPSSPPWPQLQQLHTFSERNGTRTYVRSSPSKIFTLPFIFLKILTPACATCIMLYGTTFIN